MSISINSRVLAGISSLSQTAQQVINLLHNAEALFSRAIASEQFSLHFSSEENFLKSYWQGVNGEEMGYLPNVKSWAAPESLYALDTADLELLSNKNTSANKSQLTQFFQRMHWYSDEAQLAFTEFEQNQCNGEFYRLGQISPLAKTQFYYRTLMPLSQSNILKKAVDCSFSGSSMGNELLDLIEVAISLEQFELSESFSANSLFQSMKVHLDGCLSAPSSASPPNESELASIQSSWLEANGIIGFSSLSTACRIVAQLFTSKDDIEANLPAVVANKIALIKQFFTTTKASNAFLSQCGKFWYYEFSNQDYRAQLRWQPEQILSLVNFESISSDSKQVKTTKQSSSNQNKSTRQGKGGGKTQNKE